MAMPIICESDKITLKQTGKVISLMLKTNVTHILATVCLQCHQKMSLSKLEGCLTVHLPHEII